jgi:hypothetical protein
MPRTEEELGRVLEEHKLTFLLPLLHLRAEIWRQLQAEPAPALLPWLEATVPPAHQTDPAFVLALVHNILRFVTEKAGSSSENVEAEKELMATFKPVLQAFIKNSPALQLTAVYAMQVGGGDVVTVSASGTDFPFLMRGPDRNASSPHVGKS